MTPPARSGAPKDNPPKPAPPPPPRWRNFLPLIGLVVMLAILIGPALVRGSGGQQLDYSTFVQRVQAGQVQSVAINNTSGAVTGELKPATSGGTAQHFETQVPAYALNTNTLGERLEAQGVDVTATTSTGFFSQLVLSILPLLLLVGLFIYVGRRSQNQIQGIGRSGAKVFDAQRPSVKFDDVAGYAGVKREVSEVVDYLSHPEKYKAAGARGPRGVVMVGPPGTGKTLLARAVAGEAGVPFFSVTGSSFVEMFVGVGASRVRDLFTQARKRSPAIVFIDEIDAIGGKRDSGGMMGRNDEREQTLNQLLAEMDGFDERADVVVIAATNRPETLDAALTRPGRFDRQVQVPLPNQAERHDILRVHSRGKTLDPDVDLTVVARGTPGFSGADLANLVNEAAIFAVREGREVLSAADFDGARDRVILGRREDSNVLLPEERHSVAVHEGGHAIVAVLSEEADPVSKVTILPAGMALGVTHQLPESERRLYTEQYMRDSLAVRLGGRAAELVVFGQGSTGASNDLAGATQLATRMVREFGLSPRLGPVGYASDSPSYLGNTDIARPYSDETQEVIDTEVARLVREAEERAVSLLTQHRPALDALAARLLERETVDGRELEDIVRSAPTAAPAPVA